MAEFQAFPISLRSAAHSRANSSSAGAQAAHAMGMPRRFMKAVSLLLGAAMLNLSLLPLSTAHAASAKAMAAARLEPMRSPSAALSARKQSASEGYAQAVLALQTHVALGALAHKSQGAVTATVLAQQADALRAEWRQLRARWAEAGVSQAHVDHQLQLEAEFEAKHNELLHRMAAANNSGSAAALSKFLAEQAPKRTHWPMNLQHMPWQVNPVQRSDAAVSAAELNQRMALASPMAAKSSGGSEDGRKATTAATAADYAATIDAPHTEDIRALAASLKGDPYRIYQWVHDHVRYVPTHGSVQGAQNTLEKKAGNAMDQASLLVALLRASGIASRYVYGTIEIPAEKAMNWVGGVKTTDAVQQLLGQGGVPNTALVSGGKVVAMRMEHVWVEAFIQYYPARGTRHVAGVSTPDAWVPLDASYKQTTHTPGMALADALPLDADALINAVAQGGQVNAEAGWVQGLNADAVATQLQQYSARVEAHVAAQNGGQTTVGQLLGANAIEPDGLPVLSATLPYTVRARSQQFSQVPSALRAQFKYAIYPDQRSASWGQGALLSWQTPTVAIAGQKLTLAWVVATETDLAAIAALLPKPVAGQALSASQIPSGLPGSIKLKPELRLNGQTVATGSAFAAGSELVGSGAFTQYTSSQWDTTTEPLIAGQQTALGVSVQGMSPKQFERLKERLQTTQAKLAQAQHVSDDALPGLLDNLHSEHLGDLLTATMWGYFAAQEMQAELSARQAQVVDIPGLSYGLMHAQVKPRKVFGSVSTGLTFQGLNMDVGHLRHIRWVMDDNPQSAVNQPPITANGRSTAHNRWIAYNKGMGQYSSALEHFTPEAMWVDRSQCRHEDGRGQVQNPSLPDCPEGVSAVKAMAIAHAQGQKLYTVHAGNRATALAGLTVSGDVGSEIRSAIQAGKEVSFHPSRIDAHGWTGYGYSIVDPLTGVGGYLLESSGNGGVFEKLGDTLSTDGFVITAISGVNDLCQMLEKGVCRLMSADLSIQKVGNIVATAVTSLLFMPIDSAMSDVVNDNMCLTEAQAQSVVSALTGLGALRSVNGPMGLLAHQIGLSYVLYMTLHFVKTNRALGECDRVITKTSDAMGASALSIDVG